MSQLPTDTLHAGQLGTPRNWKRQFIIPHVALAPIPSAQPALADQPRRVPLRRTQAKNSVSQLQHRSKQPNSQYTSTTCLKLCDGPNGLVRTFDWYVRARRSRASNLPALCSTMSGSRSACRSPAPRNSDVHDACYDVVVGARIPQRCEYHRYKIFASGVKRPCILRKLCGNHKERCKGYTASRWVFDPYLNTLLGIGAGMGKQMADHRAGIFCSNTAGEFPSFSASTTGRSWTRLYAGPAQQPNQVHPAPDSDSRHQKYL